MKFKIMEVIVPRRNVEHFMDILTMNGIICTLDEKMQQPGKPSVIAMMMPESFLIDFEDEDACECGEVHEDETVYEEFPPIIEKEKKNN